MTIREQVAADWEKRKNQHPFPRSWYAYDLNGHDITLAESYAAGCITTYLNQEPGERLDDERIQYLIGCREEFLKAVSNLTDQEGKWLLELYLLMSTMVLVDCGVLDAGELANLPPTP